MRQESDERAVVDAERAYWQSIQDKDAQMAWRLTDEACLLVGSQGVRRVERETFTRMLESSDWMLQRFELSDVDVRMVGPDVAVIGYKVHEELTVEGKPVSLDAADASTWIRRGDGWVCTLHTESILGDPFGRDRRPS